MQGECFWGRGSGGGIKNGWDGYEGGERENWLT